MSSVFELNDENFEQEVLKHGGAALVDFYTDWCAPCKMLSPIIEEMASDYDGRVKIGSLNAEKSSETASKYSITSVPTLLFFNKGELVDSHIGMVSKETIQEKIDSIL